MIPDGAARALVATLGAVFLMCYLLSAAAEAIATY